MCASHLSALYKRSNCSNPTHQSEHRGLLTCTSKKDGKGIQVLVLFALSFKMVGVVCVCHYYTITCYNDSLNWPQKVVKKMIWLSLICGPTSDTCLSHGQRSTMGMIKSKFLLSTSFGPCGLCKPYIKSTVCNHLRSDLTYWSILPKDIVHFLRCDLVWEVPDVQDSVHLRR